MNDRPGPFQLGHHRVDPATNRVLGPCGEVRLEPKVMAVLLALAERAGEVVTREALIDLVWGVRFGGDESLTRAISILRRLLGDGRVRAACIETIPKRGYRLVTEPTIASIVPPGAAVVGDARAAGLRLAAAAVGLTGGSRLGRETASPWRRSAVIAVLPFDNRSTEPANELLADGLADEIRSSLSRNTSVAVIAGSSSFRFRGGAKDLAAITEALGVSYVVDGAVHGEADGVRVAVHLVDTATGLIVWSGVEDRPRDQIFTIRDEVSRAILAALRIAPTTADNGAKTPPSPAAYETYLQSLALLRDGTPANCERAIEFLSGLVGSDSTFADAWASLALARLQLVFLLLYDPPGQIEAARAEARRALDLHPRSIEARLALAVADYRDDTVPIAETERRFAELLREEPNNPDLNLRMALLLGEVGRIAEAAAMLARAYQLDPLSAPVVWQYAWCLLRIGETSGAEAMIDETVRRWGARDWGLWYLKFDLFLRRGEFAAARAWIDETRWISSHSPRGANVRAVLEQIVAFTSASDPATAQRERRAMLAAVGRSEAQYPAVVRTLIGVGDHDTAFELARQQIAAGSRWFRGSSLMLGPMTAKFLADARVMELFAANGLAAYWLETDRWPDFSAQPDLPYDCRALARALVGDMKPRPPADASRSVAGGRFDDSGAADHEARDAEPH